MLPVPSNSEIQLISQGTVHERPYIGDLTDVIFTSPRPLWTLNYTYTRNTQAAIGEVLAEIAELGYGAVDVPVHYENVGGEEFDFSVGGCIQSIAWPEIRFGNVVRDEIRQARKSDLMQVSRYVLRIIDTRNQGQTTWVKFENMPKVAGFPLADRVKWNSPDPLIIRAQNREISTPPQRIHNRRIQSISRTVVFRERA